MIRPFGVADDPAMTAHALMGPRQQVASDVLLHPVPLLAISVLLFNDHVLKQAFPGFVTGKLSDFAGLVFFPLLLVAAWSAAGSAVGRPGIGGHRSLLVVTLATGVVFAAVNLVGSVADVYEAVLGLLQWLAGLPLATITGVPLPSPGRVELTQDPTDLIALPALLLAYAVGDAHRRSDAPGRRTLVRMASIHSAMIRRQVVRPRAERRRISSIVALIIAGVASLATSYPAPTTWTDTASGNVLVENGSAQLTVRLFMPQPVSVDPDDSQILFYIDPPTRAPFFELYLEPLDPESADVGSPAGPVEVRFTRLAETPRQSEWMSTPGSSPIAADLCPSVPCALTYQVDVRSKYTSAAPFVMYWWLEAFVSPPESGSVDGHGLDLTITGLSATPGPIDKPILGGLLAGGSVALLVSLLVGALPLRGRRLAILELAAATALVIAGAYLSIGLAQERLPPIGPSFVIIGALIFGSYAVRSARVWQPRLTAIPAALLVLPSGIGAFALPTLYSEHEAFLAQFAAGALGVVAAPVAVSALRKWFGRLDLRDARLWLATGAAGIAVLLTFGKAIDIAFKLPPNAGSYVLLPELVAVVSAVSFWHWLTRGPMAGLFGGLMVIFSAPALYGLEYFIASNGASASESASGVGAFGVIALPLLAFAGIVLALSTRQRPRAREPEIPTARQAG